MASEELTSAGYIRHHLQNSTFGQHQDGSWGFAHTAEQAKEMGFWAIHVDTMAFSIGLGVLFLYFSRRLQKRQLQAYPVDYRIS